GGGRWRAPGAGAPESSSESPHRRRILPAKGEVRVPFHGERAGPRRGTHTTAERPAEPGSAGGRGTSRRRSSSKVEDRLGASADDQTALDFDRPTATPLSDGANQLVVTTDRPDGASAEAGAALSRVRVGAGV